MLRPQRHLGSNQQVGKYITGKQLEAGRFGVVYAARIGTVLDAKLEEQRKADMKPELRKQKTTEGVEARKKEEEEVKTMTKDEQEEAEKKKKDEDEEKEAAEMRSRSTRHPDG